MNNYKEKTFNWLKGLHDWGGRRKLTIMAEEWRGSKHLLHVAEQEEENEVEDGWCYALLNNQVLEDSTGGWY